MYPKGVELGRAGLECGMRDVGFGSQIVWPGEVSESPLRRGMVLICGGFGIGLGSRIRFPESKVVC